MSYSYRIKHRVNDEGFIKTLKYVVYVGYYSLHNHMQEMLLDLKYSGKLLDGNHKTLYKYLGSNDVYHTDYSVMPHIFKLVDITPQDVLVDVGCGKGRVINYWLSCRLENRIVGLELDPNIAEQTSAQFRRWNNVQILPGDAIANLPEDGTIFYFYNPFEAEKVQEFESYMYGISHDRNIKIVYYNPKSIYVFNTDRWDIKPVNFEKDLGIKRWGRINKYHDLAIISRRQI